MESDDPMGGAMDAALARLKQESRASYENSVCKWMFQRYGYTDIYDDTVKAERDAGASPLLTLWHFHDALPDFPVRLGVSRLYGLQDIDLPELFKRFDKSPVYKHYLELCDSFDDTATSVGMVFNWPRLARQTVLHDYTTDLNITTASMFIPVGRKKRLLVLQPLVNLLDSLNYES